MEIPFINLLRSRRSVRRYKNESVTEDAIEILKEAVLRSPSSRGINPWEFIFVTDKDILDKLAKSKEHGSEFLKSAALGIVVLGDETKSDVWIEDCSIASTIAHITAHSLGLGSCWIQIRNRFHNQNVSSEKFIQDLLHIPAHLRVEAIISIGTPEENKAGIPSEILDYTKVRTNSYLS